MLIGRTTEFLKLRQALLERRSLLVYGPAGSGKSALAAEVVNSLPLPVQNSLISFAQSAASPRDLFHGLASSMALSGADEILARAGKEAGSATETNRWLAAQTSLRLRGILRSAARTHAYTIVLDSSVPIPEGAYRLLQEWVWSGRTPILLLARSSSERELGKVARLFWHDGLRLLLGALEPPFAVELLEDSIRRFGLARFADSAFRQFVFLHSERLPGRIIRLCEMASSDAYRWNGQIKLHTLAVDFLIEQNAIASPVVRAASHG
jgi:hypothetical protein